MSVTTSALTAAAAQAAVGTTPRKLRMPVIWRLRVDPHTSPTDPSTLDRPCVTVTSELHPGLVLWLGAAGWDVDSISARTARPKDVRGEPAEVVARALGADAAAAVEPRGRRTDIVCQAGTLALSPGRLRVAKPADRRLSPLDAVEWLRQSTPELVIVDPLWQRLAHTAAKALRFDVDAENPARVRVRSAASSESSAPLPAAAQLEKTSSKQPVSVSADAVDLMDMAAAGPASRPGLYPHQDETVSLLAATEIGAVLATPPGAGKTVICAAALSERDWEGPVVVAAPTAVVAQWEDELRRWASSLRTRRADSVEHLRRRLRDSDVVVTTHDVASRWGSTTRSRIGLVILDEALVLSTSSRRASGLWALRKAADRAWALTGTPDENGRGKAADLVAWVRRRPRGSVAAVPASEFNPVVAAANTQGVTPALRTVRVAVSPEPEDLRWLAALADDVSSDGSFGGARSRERARLGLGDPVAAGGAGAATPAKRRAALERLGEHARSGRAALAFTGSLNLARVVAGELRDRGVRAEVLEASMSRSSRVALLGAFATGEVNVLLITPASQRGVNLQNADLVVHLDLPASSADFVQRNARAARIGSAHSEVEVWVAHLAGTWDELWVDGFLSSGAADPLAGVGGSTSRPARRGSTRR